MLGSWNLGTFSAVPPVCRSQKCRCGLWMGHRCPWTCPRIYCSIQQLLEARKKAQEDEEEFGAEARQQAIDQALAYCQKFKYANSKWAENTFVTNAGLLCQDLFPSRSSIIPVYRLWLPMGLVFTSEVMLFRCYGTGRAAAEGSRLSNNGSCMTCYLHGFRKTWTAGIISLTSYVANNAWNTVVIYLSRFGHTRALHLQLLGFIRSGIS